MIPGTDLFQDLYWTFWSKILTKASTKNDFPKIKKKKKGLLERCSPLYKVLFMNRDLNTFHKRKLRIMNINKSSDIHLLFKTDFNSGQLVYDESKNDGIVFKS